MLEPTTSLTLRGRTARRTQRLLSYRIRPRESEKQRQNEVKQKFEGLLFDVSVGKLQSKFVVVLAMIRAAMPSENG